MFSHMFGRKKRRPPLPGLGRSWLGAGSLFSPWRPQDERAASQEKGAWVQFLFLGAEAGIS